MVNKVILLGTLGQDPELKFTPNGAAVCNFSVAMNESWTDKTGTKQERTEWARIVVWGKQAESCNQYLSKGRQAYIEGSLSTRSYENKEGIKVYVTEIKATTVQFIGGSKDVQQNVPNKADNVVVSKEYKIEPKVEFQADDIPF